MPWPPFGDASRAWRSAVVVAVCSGLGPAMRVVGHGPNGERGGALLAAGAALLGGSSFVASRPGGTRRERVVAGSGVVAALVLIGGSVPFIGRAPALVTAALGVTAAAALYRARCGNIPAPSRPALIPLVLGAVLWAVTANVVAVVPAVVLAAAIVLTAGRRHPPAGLVAFDSRLRRGVGALVSGTRTVAVQARAAVVGVAGAVSRVLVARPVRRSVAAAVRWLGERSLPVAVLVAAGVAALATAPVFRRQIARPDLRLYGFNDYPIHLQLADWFNWVPLDVSAPHPVFHALASLVATGVGEPAGAIVVLAAATGGLAALLGWFASQGTDARPGFRGGQAALLGLLVAGIESPTALLNAFGAVVPASPYAGLHTWSSPTDTVALPLALLFIAAAAPMVGRVDPDWGRPNRSRVVLLGVTLLATLAKPALAVGFVPAFLLACIVARTATARRVVSFLVWCAVPAGVVLLWQFWFLRTDTRAAAHGFADYGITFEPFRFVAALGFGPDGPWFFWLSTVWVVLGAWAAGRRYWLHPPVMLAWAALLATLPPALLLGESGAHAGDANLVRPVLFGWSAWVMLSAIFVAREARAAIAAAEPGRSRPRWLAVAGVCAVLWAAGGVVVAVDAVSDALPGSTYPRVCRACES